MFWKYTLFEAKLLLQNRKNWFVAIFLLLFYLIYFMYPNQEEPIPLKEQKSMEARQMNAMFDHIQDQRKDIPEIGEVYDILTKQSSIINFQVYYLGMGHDSEQYIENGLELNQLRLKVHELGNKGLPSHLIKSKEDILKDDALLRYIKENQLPIETNSFVTNFYFVNALKTMSGILFLCIVLISGSELLVFEQRHRTVVKGFPISFMKKIHSKVVVHFLFIYTFLLIGFFAGIVYAGKKLNAGDFSFPILIYRDSNYIAVPTVEYLVYMFIGLAVATILVLYFSILLNMLFKNAFANILVGLGVFLLPDLLGASGINATFIQPIKYIDLVNVLSGDLATKLGNSQLDFSYALLWLAGMTLLMIGIVYSINKYTYYRKPKNAPLEKAF